MPISPKPAAEGWKKYEWRWALREQAKIAAAFDRPLWLGDEPVAGKRILLHAEQGLGDTIQFCRFAGAVAALGARVTLEVQPELTSLLAGLAGPELLIASGEARPAHDLHCPLGSLPLALRIAAEDFAPARYLSAPKARAEAWERKLRACSVRGSASPGPAVRRFAAITTARSG